MKKNDWWMEIWKFINFFVICKNNTIAEKIPSIEIMINLKCRHNWDKGNEVRNWLLINAYKIFIVYLLFPVTKRLYILIKKNEINSSITKNKYSLFIIHPQFNQQIQINIALIFLYICFLTLIINFLINKQKYIVQLSIYFILYFVLYVHNS